MKVFEVMGVPRIIQVKDDHLSIHKKDGFVDPPFEETTTLHIYIYKDTYVNSFGEIMTNNLTYTYMVY